VREVGPRTQNQRVRDPHQASGGPHLGRHYAAIGLVSLAGLEQSLRRRAGLSAPRMIPQAAEQRNPIESPDAPPRNAAVPADQGGGRPVPDQPEILQWKVTGAPPDRTEFRIELEHVVTPRAQRT